MFCKLSLLSLVAPLVSALTLQVPTDPTSGGTITIKWTAAQNDPETFSFELTNAAFNNAFAIANNVNPTAQTLTLTLPIVPVGDGYTLQAVNVGDINDVFASTPTFSIGATTSSSGSGVSTSASSTTKAASTTFVASTSVTSVASTTPTSLVVTSGTSSGTLVSSSSGASSASTTPSTAAALSSRLGLSGPASSIAAILLSVAGGAAMIAL